MRGFEPPAPASRTQCSTRLSHIPIGGRLWRNPLKTAVEGFTYANLATLARDKLKSAKKKGYSFVFSFDMLMPQSACFLYGDFSGGVAAETVYYSASFPVWFFVGWLSPQARPPAKKAATDFTRKPFRHFFGIVMPNLSGRNGAQS